MKTNPDRLIISSSPHIKGPASTTGIMLDVIIAMLPVLAAAIYNFGVRSLYITGICVFTCVFGELIFELITKRPVTIGNLSAVVTGMLLAFNLPVSIPEWQAVIGSLVAIIAVKQLFGGIGHNFANPAVTARIVLTVSFATSMSAWTLPVTSGSADAVSSATPLAAQAGGEALPSLFNMFIGRHPGCIGETCSLAIIIGFIYLLCRKVITWHTPIIYVGVVFILSLFAKDFSFESALYQILSGGLLLGAVFMATDYSTSPPTPWGKAVFAIGCGLITVAIRLWGTYPEGVSFSILFMNILTPYITKLTAHRPLGGAKTQAAGQSRG